jgi:nitrate/nitrite transporter NarK
MKNQDGDPPDTEVMNSDSNDRMTAQEASPTEAASRFVRRRSLARELLAAQCLEAELSIDPNLFTMEPAVTPFDGEHSVPELSQESPCDNDPAVSMSAQETRSNEAAPSVDRVNFSETRVEYECTHSIEEGNEDSKQEMEIEEEEESVYPEESRDPEDSKHDTFSRATFSRAPNEIEEEGDPFSNIAAADSKYTTYNVAVNPYQEDRAVDIPLYSSARPHMRAFHLAWGAFFVAFFTWFAMTPLLGEIAISLDLSREEIWTSSVLAVSSSAATRILMGPLNDRYGARWVMSVTLVLAAIPTGLAGLVDSANSLYVVRFLIGVAGSAFVTCQYWTSCMFTMEIAGTANALAAGWGNMGGGVAQVVMGSLLFPLFKIIFGGEGYQRFHGLDKNSDDERPDYDRASDLAWRVILVFPALLSLGVAWVVVRHADDTPKGNTSRRLVEPISATTALSSSISNRNTWLLSFQYACCFGVEITMIQAAALYFQEEFGQSTEAAAAIASIFGWINLFARGIGGYCR